MSIFQNTCKPEGMAGRFMINSMNLGHKSLHLWGFKQIEVKDNFVCLDIGCGGGTNVKRLLDMNSTTKVYGVDYSELCVEKSSKKCKKYIDSGRCEIQKMDVKALSFENNKFDLVTAFETIYFWRDINVAFKNVYNVLKEGGKFLICNESNGKNKSQEKWCEIIDGMVIYKIDEIKESLERAGFKDIKINDEDKVWLTVIATK